MDGGGGRQWSTTVDGGGGRQWSTGNKKVMG